MIPISAKIPNIALDDQHMPNGTNPNDPAPISTNQLLRSSLRMKNSHNQTKDINNTITIPWHVSISGNCKDFNERFDGSHHCSGVIIDQSYVLSAAHCFYGDGKFSQLNHSWHHDFLRDCEFVVRAGGFDLEKEFPQVKATFLARYSQNCELVPS